jgi:hypothetical protein
MELVDGLSPLAALLRRYAYAYTAAHDFAVCAELMVPDYVLRMGENEIRGRDDQYVPATAKQYRQYPGLGFTVHDLVLGEDRAALHFTEHGRSTLLGGLAAWRGVSLYRWDGARLVECLVEQDYHARREQQRAGTPQPILAPGLDPWTAVAAPADPETERLARSWLLAGGLLDAPIGSLDDEHCAPPRRALLSRAEVGVLDLFTAGRRAAFHVVHRGRYAGGLPDLDGYRHRDFSLYASGIATVDDDGRVEVTAVTDRLGAEQRLDDARRGR